MFGNRMVYIKSPGGQRRGLIYQSGDAGASNVFEGVFDLTRYTSYLYNNDDYIGLKMTKSGDIYFMFNPYYANSYLSSGIHYYDHIDLYDDDWMPLFVIDPIKITINNTVIDLNSLEFEDDHFKCVRETFTYTNSLDQSSFSVSLLVVYINSNDMTHYPSAGVNAYKTIFDDKYYYKHKLNAKTNILLDYDNYIEFDGNCYYFSDLRNNAYYASSSYPEIINFNSLNVCKEKNSYIFNFTKENYYNVNYFKNHLINYKSDNGLVISKNISRYNPFEPSRLRGFDGSGYAFDPTGLGGFTLYTIKNNSIRDSIGFYPAGLNISETNNYISTPSMFSNISTIFYIYDRLFECMGASESMYSSIRCSRYGWDNDNTGYNWNYFLRLTSVYSFLLSQNASSNVLNLNNFNETFNMPDEYNP